MNVTKPERLVGAADAVLVHSWLRLDSAIICDTTEMSNTAVSDRRDGTQRVV